MREKPNVEDDEDIHAWKTAALASLKNTKFVVQDYGKSEGTAEAFDTITCLSVVKWIHFHHGDAGMRFVFQKFFDSLRPKGYLILEPQEWSSYQKAKRKQVRNRSQQASLLKPQILGGESRAIFIDFSTKILFELKFLSVINFAPGYKLIVG